MHPAFYYCLKQSYIADQLAQDGAVCTPAATVGAATVLPVIPSFEYILVSAEDEPYVLVPEE